ncbi:MAG: transcription elongation factor GreB [Gammaproteobacteria bacterium]|nr:transcription elongation factor GreB [Gammaproteobacteria bacterium]
MSRYRPPSTPSSPYITLEGVLKLRHELQYLWTKKRPEVTQAVHEAAKQGDRSENAEYIYGKKQLRQIDSRVRFLRKRLDVLKVVEQIPADKTRVFFGAWVALENDEGEEKRYRIVGPDEFGDEDEYISMDSPIAKALLGKRLDEEVSVETPGGTINWIIVDIEYRD